MDRKGANTFPFYNLPPEPRAIFLRNFSVLLSFPFGENKRRSRLLLPRHFANQRSTVSSRSTDHTASFIILREGICTSKGNTASMLLYPKICPLMFSKIVSYIDGYKHLMEENNFFLKMNKGVFDWHLNRMSFDWNLDKELRLGF